MKALKLPFFRFFPFLMPLLLVLSCVPAATTLHNSGNFSNLRSEIRLTDGSVIRGYASLNAMKGEDALRVRVAGERSDRTIPLARVDRLLAEEHEFVVKWLQTPVRAKQGGKPSTIRAMVKRLGMEQDALQVYEYKFPVSNPKSPISNTMTAWFVSFPGDPADLPLCELNSHAYKLKWAKISSQANNKTAGLDKAPSSVKGLLEQVKKLTGFGAEPETIGAAE